MELFVNKAVSRRPCSQRNEFAGSDRFKARDRMRAHFQGSKIGYRKRPPAARLVA